MNIAVLLHVPFEGPGHIRSWAFERGHVLKDIQLFAGDEPPELDAVEALIVMGGPMGVYDEHEYDWLCAEKKLIRAFITTKKPIIGICLGSQLIAEALGSRIYKNNNVEIGWFPVRLTREARETWFSDLSASTPQLFIWHADAFDLPPGATLLASSEATKVQAFAHSGHILGLLCHLEASESLIDSMLEQGRGELVGQETAPYVQSEATIRHNLDQRCIQSKKYLYRLLDRFFASQSIGP